MSSLKPYPRSKKQPAWLFQYTDLITGKWTQRVLHCSREQANGYKKSFDADYNYLKMHPDEIEMNPTDYTIKYATVRFIKTKAVDKAHTTFKRYHNVLDHLI